MDFYSKNKFEKLVHLVGFTTRTASFLVWLALFDMKRGMCGSVARIKRGEVQAKIYSIGIEIREISKEVGVSTSNILKRSVAAMCTITIKCCSSYPQGTLMYFDWFLN